MKRHVRSDCQLQAIEYWYMEKNFGAQTGIVPLRQDQKVIVVGDHVQPIIWVAEIPSNLTVTHTALLGGNGKIH